MDRLLVDIKKQAGNFSLDMRFDLSHKKTGILGKSGSGKSMTLRCIAGIEKPDFGNISLGDDVFFDSGSKINLRPQKRNVGYLFQNYALFPTMNVFENILCGIREKTPKADALVKDIISAMNLSGLEKHYPKELSGGQQQRVALARILIGKPKLLLLDEPFSSLDASLKDRMQQELIRIVDEYNGQVIMVSHNRDELYRFCEKLIVIDNGRLLRQGNTADVFKDPRSKTAASLTGCKNFCRVNILGEHTLELPGWGLCLKLKRKIPEGVTHIGYRAHYFEPIWGEVPDNAFCFTLNSTAHMPFETNYYLDPIRSETTSPCRDDVSPVCWFVQDEMNEKIIAKGMPQSLRLKEEHILFLYEDNP